MPVILDVGPVFDVAAFYLNGKRLGQVGRFPDGKEPAFTEAAHRARFLVNPGDWAKDGRNELVAVVYRERGVGGLPGIPGILLANPLVERHPNFDEIQDGFDIFVQSGLLDEAEKLLAKARPTSRTERAWFLSHKAHLAFLRWRDGGNKGKRLLDNILAPVAEILKELPSESPKQSAMQAFCRVLRLAEKEGKTWKAVKRHFPRFSAGCQCLDSDRTTRGDWQLHYGRNFHVLAAMGQKCDWTGGDDCSLFAYQLQIPGGKDSPRLWLPQRQREVGHPSALLMPYSYKHALAQRNGLDDNEVTASLLPGVNIRRASWWDDHGEMHPFDDEGPDFLVSLQMPSGRHLVSFYLQDYDWRHTLHPRQQSCMLFDHSGHLLNAVWGGKLDEGAYSRFLVSGETHIRTRFNKHRGACVAVNGVFADSAAPIDPNCLDCAREIAPIAREIAVAESSFDTFRAVKQIHDRLHGIDSLEALGKLLTAVDGMEAVHPCWHYLVVARMLNLMRNRENADMGNALEVISRSCRESTSYPLLGITANFMAGRGFSQDDPLLIKIRNAVPFPFHAPAAPNSQGGLQ